MSQSIDITLAGLPCLAWSDDYDVDKWISYDNPRGQRPGVAYCLMLEQHVNQLNTTGSLELNIAAGDSIGISRLWFDKAECVSGGKPPDGNRAYLVTLWDSRKILSEFTYVNRQFNVRCPAPPATSTDGSSPEEFYVDSLNDGEPWTWDEVVAEIWGELPGSLVGQFPGLGVPVYGVPQNLRYQGVNAWQALHDVLGLISATTAYDPQNDKFSIVNLAQNQPGLQAAEQQSAGRLLSDQSPVGSGAVWAPETIRVVFHRQAKHFGTEPDTPRQDNWADDGQLAWYDVSTGIAGAIPGTIMRLVDSQPAMADFDNSPLNVGSLQQRAQFLAEQWTDSRAQSIARKDKIYQGIVAAFDTPGSQVSAVTYYGYRDHGIMTQILLTPGEPFANGQAGGQLAPVDKSENLLPTDLARATTPTYPRSLQLVKITSDQADNSGRYSAVVVKANPSGIYKSDQASESFSQLEPCLIAGPNGEQLVNGSVYGARINGTATTDQDQALPFYIALIGSASARLGRAAADIKYKTSGPVNYYKDDGTPGTETQQAGQQDTVYNYFFGMLPRGNFVWYEKTGDGWYATAAEQNFYGKVNGGSSSPGAPVSATFPGGTVQVTLWEGGNATNTVIDALPEHFPVIQGEFVTVQWNGREFVIVACDAQTMRAKYVGTTALLPAPATSASFKISLFPNASPTQDIDFGVVLPTGNLLCDPANEANTPEIAIARNANGFFVISGQTTTIYGKVPGPFSPGAGLSATPVGGTVKVKVYKGGNDTGSTINASVEHAPIIDTEFVTCAWMGNGWQVIHGDYDGGINGKLAGGTDLAKGSSSSSWMLQVYPDTAPTTAAFFSITCRLGTIKVDKEVRISRDATGFYATSAEC